MPKGGSIKIAVLGVGGVGHHFLTQLALLTKTNPIISLVLISRSNKTLFANESFGLLSLQTWESDLSASTTPAFHASNILEYLKRMSGQSIVIDNTNSADIAAYYPTFLSHGISVITPNKKAFSGSLFLWRALFPSPSPPSYGLCYHESTVGAGLPIISTLRDLLATGDTIHRIEGVFSGTMSFLFNTFAPVSGASNDKWSTVVRRAKELGFTEPDPRDDLNGVDVARKLVILARIVGLEVEGVDSFSVESLIPNELNDVKSGEAFLEKLGEFDERMEGVKNQAEAEGKVVRFVGSIDVKTQSLKVGLDKFDKGHPIAGLKGSDNIVNFYTERYGSSPLVVQGAGAGGAVTAMGVTADLIKVVQRLER